MSEGYLLMAFADPKFAVQANAAAMSMRACDPVRPVSIVADRRCRRALKKSLFDKIIQPRGFAVGNERHLFLDEYSPYERTIYADSDTIMLLPEPVEVLWGGLLCGLHIGIQGEMISADDEWRIPVAPVLRRFGLERIVSNNGGVVYFDRSDKARAFFETARGLYNERPPEISIKHVSGGGLANEPFYAVSLAINGIPPVSGFDLNLSTKNISNPSILLSGDGGGAAFVCTRAGRERRPWFLHFLGLGGPRCPSHIHKALEAIYSHAYQR